MKIKIERVTARNVNIGPNGELPYRMYTYDETDVEDATQEDIEQRVLEEIRPRLEAITVASACKLEITLRVIDEES